MKRSWSTGGLIAAGWVGAVAGLFDSLASFLHPVSLVVIPLSVTQSALVSLILYTLLETVRWLMGRGKTESHPGFPLGVVVGFWVGFFGCYFVSTSTLSFFSSSKGTLAGLLVSAVMALLALLATYRVVATGHRGKGYPSSPRVPVPASAWILLLIILAAPALALIHAQRDGSYQAGTGKPPRGFILVSLDAARGDRISGLGYHRPTTPHIDSILAQSVAFSRAYVETPGSGPGHASMLSGLPTAAHGVTFNTAILDHQVVTLAERLKEAGYNTAAFINNYYLESRFGFAQGFDTFINQYRATYLDGWHPRLLLRGTSLFHIWHRLTTRSGQKNNDTIEETLTWLRHRPPGDFFIFLHIMDPHSPYAPPQDLRDKFYVPQGDPVFDTEDLRRDMDRMTPTEAQALCDLYDGGVAQADRKVGLLIAELRRLNLFDSTLLVITADHGEELADHGNIFDHGGFWNGNLHVPLIFSYPDRLPEGLVLDHPVSASAIAPTALALLDVPYEEQGGQDLHQSLLSPSPWRGAPAPPYVFASSPRKNYKMGCIISARFKLIMMDGKTVGFYDLLDDPGELHDLSATIAAADSNSELSRNARDFIKAFNTWQEKCSDCLVTEGVSALPDLDRDTKKRLRALGYVR